MLKTDVISLLGECQDIKDALLNDLHALRESPPKLASYLQRPEDRRIYTRDSVLGDSWRPDCEEGSVAYRLWQFSRVLHRIVVNHDCTSGPPGCMADALERPWYTYVLLNTIPDGLTFEVGIHLFHSFGPADLDGVNAWYDFLAKQQGRAIDQTRAFIISNLIYRDWGDGELTPDRIFRFSRVVSTRGAPESPDCINLVVRHAESEAPIEIPKAEDYAWFVDHFKKWSERAYRKKAPASPGLLDYLSKIAKAMGLGEEEEWSLYAFPVPSFGPGQPKSGLYIRSGMDGMCPRIRRAVSFLLASSLWPIDYLQRKRFEKERQAEREEAGKALLSLTQSALTQVQKRLGDVRTMGFVRGAERSKIRVLFQGLDQIARYGRSPGGATLPILEDLAYNLKAQGVEGVEPFSETLEVWREKARDDSVRHFFKNGAQERAEQFGSDVEDLCEKLLEFYSGALVTSELARRFISSVTRVVRYQAGGGERILPLMIFDDDFPEDWGRVESVFVSGLKLSRAPKITFDVQRWGSDVGLVLYLFEVLFEDRPDRVPKDNVVAIQSTEPCLWELRWGTDERDGEVGVAEISFEEPDVLPADKFRNRLAFVAHLLRLPKTMASLKVSEGRAVLELDFRQLALVGVSPSGGRA